MYDFNHQEHYVNNDNHNGHVASNGAQSRCQAQDSEHYQLIGRSFPSTHQMDNMSAQLTTLSKTAMLVRQRRAKLEQLSCYLCKGYLIDATTIDECMDSFCKSCIVIYLRNHNNCPKCGTLIHKTNPLSAIRSDKVLQDIVYKLVPGLYDDEMKRRREFYRGMYAISSDDDDEDSSSSYTGRGSNLSGEQHGIVSHPKPFYKPTDSIDLSIEPQSRGDSPAIYYDNKMQSIVTCFTGNLQQQQQPPLGHTFSTVDSQQFKTYLRCPARLTALQLKKFIAAKFNICKDDSIHLLYLNESLRDEYSLIDIAYIYDWRGIEHMRLLYIIERDLSKTSKLQDSQMETRLRESKQHQSVGTATQTVKRVCIDPHPKFYEETNNGSFSSDVSGRNMRSRNDQQAINNKVNINQTVQQKAPILRSYQNAVVSNVAQMSTTNGISNRNSVGLNDGSVAARLYPPKNAVSSVVCDLPSSSRTDSSKETRASRKVNSETASCSIPKININLQSLQRNQDTQAKTPVTYSKVKVDKNSSDEPGSNNTRQTLPYTMKDTMSGTSGVRPTQSSLVTLASFTESRSNHVVSMNHTTASIATMSNSYNSGLGMGTSPKVETVSQSVKNSQTPPKTPQIALRFVTERGITFVRRLNDQESGLTRPSSSSGEAERNNQRPVARPIPVLPTSDSQSVNNIGQANSQFSSQNNRRSPTNASVTGTQTSSHNTGNSSCLEGTTSARHHLKVKPVYKTFVDVTKLKSPNFKKLGYTANRH